MTEECFIWKLSWYVCHRQSAFDLYNQLLDTAEPQTEEHSDILTNLQASQKHLDFINTDYLRALDRLPTSLSNSLETSPPPAQSASSLVASLGAFGSASTARGAENETPQQKAITKKARARRVPASVVPGVTPPPDPERWLKKSERSTYVQARGKKKGGGGATQGSVEGGGVGATSNQSRGGGGGHAKGKKKK